MTTPSNLDTKSLIPFDAQGVLGPSLSLLSKASSYTPQELAWVIKILQENAESIAGISSLRGRKDFIQVVTKRESDLSIASLLQTRLLKGLEAQEPLPDTYACIVKEIAPNTLSMTTASLPSFKSILEDEENKEKLTEWLSKVLSRYLTREQVECESKFRTLTLQRPDIQARRLEVGKEIYASAQNKTLTRPLFDIFMMYLRESLRCGPMCTTGQGFAFMISSLDSVSWEEALEIVKHIENYQGLFAMAGEDASWVGPHICDMLEKIFKEKFFPSSRLDRLVTLPLQGGLGEILALIFRANHYSPQELALVAKSAKRNYTFTTGREIHGRKNFCDLFARVQAENRQVLMVEIFHSKLFRAIRFCDEYRPFRSSFKGTSASLISDTLLVSLLQRVTSRLTASCVYGRPPSIDAVAILQGALFMEEDPSLSESIRKLASHYLSAGDLVDLTVIPHFLNICLSYTYSEMLKKNEEKMDHLISLQPSVRKQLRFIYRGLANIVSYGSYEQLSSFLISLSSYPLTTAIKNLPIASNLSTDFSATMTEMTEAIPSLLRHLEELHEACGDDGIWLEQHVTDVLAVYLNLFLPIAA